MAKYLLCWEAKTYGGDLLAGHSFVTLHYLTETDLNECARGIMERSGNQDNPDRIYGEIIWRSVTRLDS